MHIQIITFRLNDLTPEGLEAHIETVAPAFALLPGLNAKYWLCDPKRNIYGGVYLWRDRAAMEAYQETELFARLTGNRHFTQLLVRDFALFERPTRITRGFGTLS
jgi:hypothetical protein